MKVSVKGTCASSTSKPTWDAINWQTVGKHVKQLQIRIAKATREGKHGKVKSLQWILTHSYHAKQLAVRRVVKNRGGKTPGIDKIIWSAPNQKMEAILSLKRRGYRAQPLRRIYISKKDGRKRPIDIPAMSCRAYQALHLLALEPVVEMKADKNAYGFRPKRSAADAIETCFNALARKHSAQYILEGDIKSCFNEISQEWLCANITMDRNTLKKWLKSGYIEKGKLYPVDRGTQQGGLCEASHNPPYAK
jgi:RNA-directed DNA polymerase